VADAAWWQTLLSGAAGGAVTGSVVLLSTVMNDKRDRARDRRADERHLRDLKHDRLRDAFCDIARVTTAFRRATSVLIRQMPERMAMPEEAAQQIKTTLLELPDVVVVLELETADTDLMDVFLAAEACVQPALVIVDHHDAVRAGRMPAGLSQDEAATRLLNAATQVARLAKVHLARYRTPI
jgi:hypothetical protein